MLLSYDEMDVMTMTNEDAHQSDSSAADRMRAEKARIDRIFQLWPELMKADADRNVGMPLEIMHAVIWSDEDGISPETYIINVLRAERERRSALEREASDNARMDAEIDAAAASGKSVLEWVVDELNEGRFTSPESGQSRMRVEDIHSSYLRELIRRFEQRLSTAAAPAQNSTRS